MNFTRTENLGVERSVKQAETENRLKKELTFLMGITEWPFRKCYRAATGTKPSTRQRTQSNNHSNISELLDNLLRGYDNSVRPDFGGPPATVEVDIMVRSMGPISEVDMVGISPFPFVILARRGRYPSEELDSPLSNAFQLRFTSWWFSRVCSRRGNKTSVTSRATPDFENLYVRASRTVHEFSIDCFKFVSIFSNVR